jgi:hypothetical protein
MSVFAVGAGGVIQRSKRNKIINRRSKLMANPLQTLTERSGSYPALRERESFEPSESESFEDREVRGRSPDEVFESREQRQYTETPTETTEGTPTPATSKRRYLIDGKEVLLDSTQERALVEYGIKQAAATLQQQQAAQAQQAAPTITNAAIARVYDEPAQIIITDLLANGNLLEEDLVELYPRTMKTTVGQMRFAFDKIADNEFKQNQIQAALVQAIERLEAMIAWANRFKAEIEGPQPETRRGRGQQFLPSTKGGVALLNKMVASSGRIKGA